MAKQYQHIKEIEQFFGIDLRSSDISRAKGFASPGTKNVQHSSQGGITHRYGSKIIQSAYGKFGITRFDTTDMLGVSKSEIIGFGANSVFNSAHPYRLVKGSFTLTNGHATASAFVTHVYDPVDEEFEFIIVQSGATVHDESLGLGTEDNPYTLSDLETAVNASGDVTMSSPSSSSVPAAFMEILDDEIAAGDALTVYYWYWEEINSPAGDNDYASIGNTALEIGSDSFRNVSAVTLGNVLYIAPSLHSKKTVAGGTTSELASLCKYDGQSFYRAGMPKGFYPILTSSGSAGSFTDAKGTRDRSTATFDGQKYRLTLKQVDKAGNIVEGAFPDDDPFDIVAPTGSVVNNIQVSTNDLDLSTKGFNTGIAFTTSAQGPGLTFEVDDGAGGFHSLAKGDIAYFWDEGQDRFIQREVTAVASGSITLSSEPIDTDETSPNYDTGADPSINDNAAISANLRVVIWRTEASPTASSDYFLVEEIPYNEIYSSAFYYDETDDDQLGATYIPPAYPHDMPPGGRLLATFNNQLIITGDEASPKTVYFSDSDGPEYHPAGTHSFDLPVIVTGAQQSAEVLACFGKQEIHTVIGDLAGFNFKVDKIADNIGLAAHASLKQIDEGILIFESYKGPYVMYAGRKVEPLGMIKAKDGSMASRLEPFFTKRYPRLAERPVLERATAAVLPDDQLYVLFVPFEDPAKPGFATTSSVTWVFDYSRGTWWEWTGLNFAGGIVDLDGLLYGVSREHDGNTGADFSNVISFTVQQQRDKGEYNYADHAAYIDACFRSHWEALGQPGLFKRFIRCRLSSHEERDASSVQMGLETYVDYDETKQSNDDTLTWTTQKDIKAKIRGELCRSMQFVFSSQRYYEPMVISGFELEAVATFRPEFKE